jgi:hypothetical protein
LGLCLISALSTSCRSRGTTKPPRDAPVAFARGDIVVVERASAEFFQARVLSVAESTLRVQTSEDGEPLVVSRSDAYRVPPPLHPFSPADPAICASPNTHWSACRISRDEPSGLTVLLDTGAELHVDRSTVLAPSGVTALNIVRHFDTMEALRRFDIEARAAGLPARPAGWIPERREPVIAGRMGEWFSAHVVELLEDGGVRVVWDGDNRTDAVPGDRVVPAPPVSRGQPRTAFALSRPSTVSQPWERVRIEALGPDQAVVVGADGAKRRLEVRGLVPLVPSVPAVPAAVGR